MPQLAFRRAFSEKVAAGEVARGGRFAIAEPKTKAVAAVLKKLKAERGVLLVLDAADKNVHAGGAQHAECRSGDRGGVHTYQMLRYPRMLVSQAAMAKLEERLQKQAGRAVMKEGRTIIQKLLLTEKGTALKEKENQYLFQVDPARTRWRSSTPWRSSSR